MNQIPIMLEVDTHKINEMLGDTFQLCAWDHEMEKEYKKILEEVGIMNLETEYRFSNDGSEVFYITRCK